VGLSICVGSLHAPTFLLFVVLILWSAVLPCACCKLTLSRWYLFILRDLRSAACVFERLCFYSTIFIAFVIDLYSSTLNLLIQLPLLFYFVLYPVWITYPPQDPIIRSLATQRTEGRFVSVLGSTSSAAILLGSYPRVQSTVQPQLLETISVTVCTVNACFGESIRPYASSNDRNTRVFGLCCDATHISLFHCITPSTNC